MKRFESIESRSGISFHTRRGFLNVGFPAGHPLSTHSKIESVAATFDIAYERLESEALARMYPFFSFPEPFVGIFEQEPAGFINPRRLVKAQLALFGAGGGHLVRDVVESLHRHRAGFTAVGLHGRYEAKRVLVAAGAWTSLLGLTPTPLDVLIRAETVMLIPVETNEAAQLAHMPALWYTFDWHPVLPHVYLVPPVRFSDGRLYLKVGADNDRDVRLESAVDARRFFQSEGSRQTRIHLEEVVSRLLPAFADRPVVTKPCILTYSASRHPIVDEISQGWFVATAGNGAGAKSSDEIGRLAAERVLR
jgi:sarcosine oxidase